MSPDDHPLDDALVRLEDHLLSLPYDRALPALDAILRAADVPPSVLRDDERARKVLHEAIVARPFGDEDTVARVGTEFELLTLEVEVLVQRLRDPASDPAEVARIDRRLAEVRARLDEVRRRL